MARIRAGTTAAAGRHRHHRQEAQEEDRTRRGRSRQRTWRGGSMSSEKSTACTGKGGG